MRRSPGLGCREAEALFGRLWRFEILLLRLATKKTELLKEDVEVNGCALNQAGGFVVTNNSGIWLWDGTGAPTLVVAQAEGATCWLNDCIADPKGRVLTGSWFYDPTKDYELGRLFCLDTNGSIRVLDEGFHLANGLGFSPDGRTLYFTDSFKRTIHAYDYDIDSGHVRNGRVIIKVADTAGLPDGLTVDAEGFIWSAEWYGSCVARYDPDGSWSDGSTHLRSKLPPSLLVDRT